MSKHIPTAAMSKMSKALVGLKYVQVYDIHKLVDILTAWLMRDKENEKLHKIDLQCLHEIVYVTRHWQSSNKGLSSLLEPVVDRILTDTPSSQIPKWLLVDTLLTMKQIDWVDNQLLEKIFNLFVEKGFLNFDDKLYPHIDAINVFETISIVSKCLNLSIKSIKSS